MLSVKEGTHTVMNTAALLMTAMTFTMNNTTNNARPYPLKPYPQLISTLYPGRKDLPGQTTIQIDTSGLPAGAVVTSVAKSGDGVWAVTTAGAFRKTSGSWSP